MEQKEIAHIYLDHNATTPVTREAADAMRPFLEGTFGNPSSAYSLGQEAKELVERSRQQAASLLGCAPEEIVFTSGGTESNNTVLKGLIDWRRPSACHVITTSVEHPAILNPAIFLMELGVEVTILPVDGFGRVDPEAVERAIRPETRLISVMLANNETGTLQPIEVIAGIAGNHGVVFHTDAAQAVGKIRVDVHELEADCLSIAGHKLYGPKGIGILYIRKGVEITPLIHGAAQEGGRRAGTENMILAAGLGAACRVAGERLERDMQNNRKMRDRLQDLLFQGIDDLVLNGDPEQRLPNTLNVSVPGLEGSKILEGIPRVLASTGAACHDRTVRLSHVLSAMGVSDRIGMGTLRFSTGRENTMDQIEEAAHYVIEQVAKMRR